VHRITLICTGPYHAISLNALVWYELLGDDVVQVPLEALAPESLSQLLTLSEVACVLQLKIFTFDYKFLREKVTVTCYNLLDYVTIHTRKLISQHNVD